MDDRYGRSVEPRWIKLDGTVNTRDLGGLPLQDGGVTASGVLIRSDNLQGLTGADVRKLVDNLGVRSVADLRTEVEVDSEGPGPLTREPLVQIHHLSLFPEAGHNTDVGGPDDDGPSVLPWQHRPDDGRRGVAGVYLRYLDDRGDSVVAALREIAYSDGATIVHCAAGKDRTGVVIAIGLAEVGVTRQAIVDDYAASAERIDAIMARLRGSSTYADDLIRMDAKEQDGADRHTPLAASMDGFLTELDKVGGPSAWVRTHGWTDADADAFRIKLVG
jgi:protein-tyrosine phosphatase